MTDEIVILDQICNYLGNKIYIIKTHKENFMATWT